MDVISIKRIALRYFPDEYFCHVQFVYKIAGGLQKKYGGDKNIIFPAALLHDIGRDNPQGIPHEVMGAELAAKELKLIGFKPALIEKIAQAIRVHSVQLVRPHTLEEKIVCSADGAAKIIYAPMFSLLSHKDPCQKPKWVLGYMRKGYAQICLLAYKKELKQIYSKMTALYKEVPREEKLLNYN